MTEGYAKKAAAAAGLTYLAPIFYDPGTTDFTPFVTRMMNEKPDIILTIGDPTGDVGLIAKTLKGLSALLTCYPSREVPLLSRVC